MPGKFDKRRTRFDFFSLGDVLPPRLDRIPEEVEPADTHQVTKSNIVSERRRELNQFTDHDVLDPTTGLRRLALVDAYEPVLVPHVHIRIQHQSPWDVYEKLGELRLGVEDWVPVGQRRQPSSSLLDPLSKLVMVRKYSDSTAQVKLQRLQQIQHPNIVSVREIFTYQSASFVVFEHMVVCLSQVAGNLLLNEIRLAAILGQILNGLKYLATKKLEHGTLTCSSIIMNHYGEVKLKGQEDFRVYQPAELRDVRALRGVTMDLMQGYCKDDEAVGVDDVVRWPLDSHAVNFLAQTTSTESITELIGHPLIALPWEKDMLVGLAFFAIIEARIGRRYAST